MSNFRVYYLFWEMPRHRYQVHIVLNCSWPFPTFCWPLDGFPAEVTSDVPCQHSLNVQIVYDLFPCQINRTHYQSNSVLVPNLQMADHTEIMQRIIRNPDVAYSVLTPNMKGFEGMGVFLAFLICDIVLNGWMEICHVMWFLFTWIASAHVWVVCPVFCKPSILRYVLHAQITTD